MKNSLHELVKVRRALSPASYNTGANNGDTIDRAGYDELLFDVQAGVLGTAATVDAKVQHGNVSDASDMADVTGAAITQLVKASHDGKKALLRLRGEGLKRYVRIVVTVGAAASIVCVNATLLKNSGHLPEDNTASAEVVEVKSVEV